MPGANGQTFVENGIEQLGIKGKDDQSSIIRICIRSKS